MDNRMVTYLTLVSNGINSDEAISVSKLNTMTFEECIKECDNMIMLLEEERNSLICFKNLLSKKIK